MAVNDARPDYIIAIKKFGNYMTLIINNADVAKLLTMETTIDALEQSYISLARGESVCRPRIDIRIPTSDPAKTYQFGSMEGGAIGSFFGVRMKSDVIYETNYNGAVTQEKYCMRPGLFCGLIFLTSVETGEPLAFINDGVLQHMRVAGDGGIGVKYMARKDAEVIGMLGAGGMARSHMKAFMAVRKIKKLQVYSPTWLNCMAFRDEMAATYNIEVQACLESEQIYQGADIVAALTDSAVPVLNGALIEKGAHIINIGAGGKIGEAAMDRVDVYLRFGDTPAPVGRPEFAIDDEYLTWEAHSHTDKRREGKVKVRAHGVALPEKRVTLADIINGKTPGRTSDDQITWSERGNIQGAQFHAVAGRVYELAKASKMGYELPTELFLQDIRD